MYNINSFLIYFIESLRTNLKNNHIRTLNSIQLKGPVKFVLTTQVFLRSKAFKSMTMWVTSYISLT
jgi:HJR/Mrr/RecB family endonuclease